jgi:hypothetical protein
MNTVNQVEVLLMIISSVLDFCVVAPLLIAERVLA